MAMIRSRNGCITCRVRKVKCDEIKPHCGNCTKTGRTCDGYWPYRMKIPRKQLQSSDKRTKTPPLAESSKVSLAILPAPVRIASPFLANELESRTFDFFREQSVPKTNRLADSAFWSYHVLQLALEEPAVKHGIMALGALQRSFEFKEGESSIVAVTNYSKALNEAKELVEQATITGNHTKVLVCAILFHCIESMLGDHVSAKTHLRGGLRLLYGNGLPGESELNDSITKTFWRLDLQAMTFWDETAPYEFIPETAKRLEAINVPLEFSSLSQAADNLMGLVHWMFYKFDLYPQDSWLDPEHHAAYVAGIKRSRALLDLWFYAFENFKAKHGTYQLEFRQKCALLSIWHIMALTHLRHSRIESEINWDIFLPEFEKVLDLAEQFITVESKVFIKGVASFEVGIVIPLFETAMRCRDPIQRRRAITMLRSTNRREGVWDSNGAAAVAERAIMVEEEGVDEVKTAGDIPDSQRVYFMFPRASLSKREVQAVFFLGRRLEPLATGQLGYAWTPRQEVIHF